MASVVEYSRETEQTSTGMIATQESEEEPQSSSQSSDQSGKKFIKRFFLVVVLGYVPTIAFAIIMYFVEGPHEDSEIVKYDAMKSSVLEEPNVLDFDSMNDTERQIWLSSWFEKAMELGRNDPGEKKWTVMRTIGFTFQTATTIGWGALAPKTDIGKVATMLFATILIPLVLYMEFLYGIGEQHQRRFPKTCVANYCNFAGLKRIATSFLGWVYQTVKRGRNYEEDATPPAYAVKIFLLVSFLVSLSILVIFFAFYQDLTLLDSLYMNFIMLSTIGYGDIIPNYYTHIPVFIFFITFGGIPLNLLIALLSDATDTISNI